MRKWNLQPISCATTHKGRWWKVEVYYMWTAFGAYGLSPWLILTTFSGEHSRVYFICYTSLHLSGCAFWKLSLFSYQVENICLTPALQPNEDPFLSSRKFKTWIHTRNFKNISQKDETHSGHIIGNNLSFHLLYTINNTKRLSCHLIRLHRF